MIVLNKYNILLKKEIVGYADVRICGLFTEFNCICKLNTNELHRVYISYDDKIVPLGVLIPENGHFTLRTRIPVKRLGKGTPEFYLTGSVCDKKEYIPIDPHKPFLHLSRIKDAKFVIVDGVSGLVID